MQRSVLKSVAATVLALCLVALAVAAVVIYSGVLDVGAVKPHYALTKWVLETTMEHSVKRRAQEVIVPPRLGHTSKTARHYDEMCSLCHGAPGKDRSEIGQGMRPKPPDLAKVAADMPERMVFWVAKNGVRMTGMPAFGKTHKDGELWEMVSFVKGLPDMSAVDYRRAAGR